MTNQDFTIYHWLRTSGLIMAFVLLALGLAAR